MNFLIRWIGNDAGQWQALREVELLSRVRNFDGSRRLLHAYDWTTTLHLHIPEKLLTNTSRRRKWDQNRTGSCLTHGWSSSLLIPHERKWLITPDFFIELAVHKLACLLCATRCSTTCVEKGCLCLFTCRDYVHVLVRPLIWIVSGCDLTLWSLNTTHLTLPPSRGY